MSPQSIPQKIRKKPTDYKLRAFVGLMFLAVAFFVGFAYVLYHQQALTKAYFQKVQFNEPKRLIRVYNKDDVEILRSTLGKQPYDPSTRLPNPKKPRQIQRCGQRFCLGLQLCKHLRVIHRVSVLCNKTKRERKSLPLV